MLLAMPAADGRTIAAHLVDAGRRVDRRIAAWEAPFSVKNELRARGYPPFKPVADTLAFAGGGPKNMVEGMHVAALSAEMKRDIVYLSFGNEIAPPSAISVALRQAETVAWHATCTLYAEDEVKPLAILTDDRSYQLDERNMFVSRPLPPAGKRRRGTTRAMQRLERAAANMNPRALEGGLFVPAGRSLAEGVPTESLRLVD